MIFTTTQLESKDKDELIKELNTKIKAHNQALEALKEREASFRLLFASNPSPMFVYDLVTLQMLEVNKAFCIHFGYSRSEFLKMKLTDFVHQEEMPRLINDIKQERPELQYSGIWKCLHKKGHIIYVNVTSHTLTFSLHDAALVIPLDITEQRNTKIALKESEDKYSSLVANIPDITWTADSSGKTIFISSNVESTYGYTQDEIYADENNLWLNRVHPSDLERVRKAYELLFIQNKKFDAEYRIRRKDGNWIWVYDRAVSTYKREGKSYADGILSDITERKHAESLQSELAAIVESSSDAIISDTLDGIITSWNKGAEKIYGYTAEEAIGKHFSILVPQGHSGETENILKTINRGESIQNYETVRRKKDGSLVNVSLTISPIKNADGKIVGISGIARDITMQQKLRAELEKARQRELHEKEIRSLEEMASLPQKPDVTVQLFKLMPLQKSVPAIFNDLVTRYEILVEKATLDEDEKTKHLISEELRQLSDELCTLKAGSPDIMEIHSKVIKKKSEDLSPKEVQEFSDKARFILLELMGYLISYYRKHSLIYKEASAIKNSLSHK